MLFRQLRTNYGMRGDVPLEELVTSLGYLKLPGLEPATPSTYKHPYSFSYLLLSILRRRCCQLSLMLANARAAIRLAPDATGLVRNLVQIPKIKAPRAEFSRGPRFLYL